MFRRDFLYALAASRFSRPLGLSLYTVRAPLAAKPEETYRNLAAAGIRELEVRPANLKDHAAFIRGAGLKPVHMFVDSAVITGAWDEWRFIEQDATPGDPLDSVRASAGYLCGLSF